MNGATEVLRIRLDGHPDPVAAFAALCDGGRRPACALLESAARGQGGSQRSVVVAAAALRVTLTGDAVRAEPLSANGRAALARLGRSEWPLAHPPAVPRDERARLHDACPFDPLRAVLAHLAPDRAADRAYLRLVGTFAFELAGRFESQLHTAVGDDYSLLVPELMLDVDHVAGRAELVAVAFDVAARTDLGRDLQAAVAALDRAAALPPPPEPRPVPATVDRSDAAFARCVERGQVAIRAGEVFQVVLSRGWKLPCTDAFAAYRRLRRDNPAPYLFFINDDRSTLFGASPESAVRFDARSRVVTVYPVAGTRPRGADEDDDARIEAELRQDAKEIAEHMMLVDIARNDIARVCEPGTRRVPLLLGVDRYRHVMHLVSRVEGRLADGLDALHALRACLNMGTLTGAPKIRASALIGEIEGAPRGAYGGAVGLLDASGDLDTAITIRAATVRDGVAEVRAGAGIVAASRPLAEAAESRAKARALLEAIGGEVA